MQLGLRQRKKRPRKDGRVRSLKHLNFVRKHKCLVDGCNGEHIEAHHVADKASAAMALKSGDEWAVSLCSMHHNDLHNWGRKRFERFHHVELRAAALWFAKRSPDPAIKETVTEHE